MKKVSLIILNWNGIKDTLECLSSVKKSVVSDFSLEIIVVDNNSHDNSIEKIKKSFPEVIIIENKNNLGFAEGNNQGIKFAIERKSDFIILLNNDTYVDHNFIKEIVNSANINKSFGIISPKIYFAPNFEYHCERYKEEERGRVIWYAGGRIDWKNILFSHKGVDDLDNSQFNKEEETDFATGCAMLIRREVFEKVGLLNEKYFIYLEDVDLCIRARKAGYKIIYQPKGVIWHKNARSSGKPGSFLHTYYIIRNRLIFGMRYASLRTKLALLKNAIFLYRRNLPGERQGVIDFFLGKFGKGSSCDRC